MGATTADRLSNNNETPIPEVTRELTAIKSGTPPQKAWMGQLYINEGTPTKWRRICHQKNEPKYPRPKQVVGSCQNKRGCVSTLISGEQRIEIACIAAAVQTMKAVCTVAVR